MPTRERRLADAARLQTRPGAEVDLVPLYVPQALADAFEALREALTDSHRLYHDCDLALQRLQRAKYGPLTDVLAALAGNTA